MSFTTTVMVVATIALLSSTTAQAQEQCVGGLPATASSLTLHTTTAVGYTYVDASTAARFTQSRLVNRFTFYMVRAANVQVQCWRPISSAPSAPIYQRLYSQAYYGNNAGTHQVTVSWSVGPGDSCGFYFDNENIVPIPQRADNFHTSYELPGLQNPGAQGALTLPTFPSNKIYVFQYCSVSATVITTIPPGSASSCVAGQYQQPGTLQCLYCAQGSYSSSPAATFCTLCTVGDYQHSIGQTSCFTCAGTWTTAGTGSTSPDDCYDPQQVCGPGREYDVTTSTCRTCPIGTYQPTTGARITCQSCPVQQTTIRAGSDSPSDCLASCGAGRYWDGAQCRLCPENTYSSTTTTFSCTPCPDNRITRQTGADSLATCADRCGRGTYIQGARCTVCPFGQYQPEEEQTSCVTCPDDRTTRVLGSISLESCVAKCGAGYFVSAGVCQQCPRGQYQDREEQTSCAICPANLSTRTTASEAYADCVFLCPPGRYQVDDTASCVPCPLGKYQEGRGQQRCLDCPFEHTTYVTGADSFEKCLPSCAAGTRLIGETCENCPLGYYQPRTKQTSCRQCVQDFTTLDTGAINSTDCYRICEAGSRLVKSERLCEACQVGYYQSLRGQTSCDKCPSGRTTAYTGAVNQDECIEICNKGHKWSVAEKDCVTCPVGEYNSQTGQLSCTPCPGGESTLDEGTDSRNLCYDLCAAGDYFDTSNKACSQCIQGYYKTGLNLRTSCSRCSSGQVTQHEGSALQTDCYTVCETGQYYERTRATCSPCPRNTYGAVTAALECKPCPASHVTTSTGAKTRDECIRECPAGEERSGDQCVLCGRGFYKTDQGVHACSRCPVHLITPSTGSTSRVACSQGNCNPGNYIVGTRCEPCSKGYYQQAKWQTSCLLCRSSYTTLNTASTDERDCVFTCPAGEFGNEDTGCQSCAQGTYKAGEGTQGCTPCPGGFTTSGERSISSSECDVPVCNVGAFRNTITNQCQSCDKGFYQDETNTIACKTCPSGTTTFADSNGFFAAKSSSACFSTDECTTGRATCHPDATCQDTTNSFRCTCKPGYIGDGVTSCESRCNIGTYCLNGGVCTLTGSTTSCTCAEGYSGERCQTKESTTNVGAILGGVFGGLGFLAILGFVGLGLYAFSRRGESPEKTVVRRQTAAPYTVVRQAPQNMAVSGPSSIYIPSEKGQQLALPSTGSGSAGYNVVYTN